MRWIEYGVSLMSPRGSIPLACSVSVSVMSTMIFYTVDSAIAHGVTCGSQKDSQSCDLNVKEDDS